MYQYRWLAVAIYGHLNDNVMTYWEGCILYHCPVLVNVRDLVTVAGVSCELS